MEYIINPVKMGGTVKEIKDGRIKINLFGRLGVIQADESLFLGETLPAAGDRLEFYFSYVQIVEQPLDYDVRELRTQTETQPCLIGGTLTEVNDTAVELEMMEHLGTVAVPRRWVFTEVEPKVGQYAEFYFGRLQRKRE